jgi:hydrogenase maturation protease
MRLLIGYGSTLRCDDGLGPYLADSLSARWTETNAMTLNQLMPELAAPISGAQQVVFLDARVGEPPGVIVSETVVERAGPAGAFTHHVTPSSLLAAARELYGAAPPALLITITGASFEYGTELSAALCALLPQIADDVSAIIAAFFNAQEQHPSRVNEAKLSHGSLLR